jgi:GTP cyclohydrolase I
MIMDGMSELAVETILKGIGEDPSRPGLKETPVRYIAALKEMTAGYWTDFNCLFKEFDAVGYTGMVVVKDVEFWSLCEHHLLPFYGVAHVGYIPAPPAYGIIGLSKLARVVDAYARRLQVQEQLTQQIAVCIRDNVKTAGSACVVESQHLCMACRGVKKPKARMVTSTLLGEFEKPEVRAEFFTLAGIR